MYGFCWLYTHDFMIECIECGSDRVENKDLMLCGTCNHARRKSERAKPLVIKPIKKVSEKRANQNAEYLKLRRGYLALYPMCEVEDCQNRSQDLHHQKGREGDLLLDTNYYMAVCRDHHIYYTEHSKEAIEKGISVSRNAKT